MPLVRITLLDERPQDARERIGDAVHDALVSRADVPPNERFQVIAAHASGEIRFDPTFAGVERLSVALVEITIAGGLSLDRKRQLHRQIAENLAAIGVRLDDVFVVLTENELADWSEGRGKLTLVDQ